jgi:predicted RNA methylase
MRRLWSIALLAAVVLALPTDSGQQSARAEDDKSPDVVFVPTPHDVVAKMLEMAKVTKDDVVYDLGCGDGRIVVAAAKKYGAKGVGFDVDPQRIKESNENVKKAGVEKLVEIKKEDIFKQDLSKASVITLYLLPSLNTRLIPQFDKMKPGSRIVSHAYDMDGVTPEKTVTIESKADGARHTIYYYTIPLKKDKKEE